MGPNEISSRKYDIRSPVKLWITRSPPPKKAFIDKAPAGLSMISPLDVSIKLRVAMRATTYIARRP